MFAKTLAADIKESLEHPHIGAATTFVTYLLIKQPHRGGLPAYTEVTHASNLSGIRGAC